MSYLVFEHAGGREVYGDEPRYSEEWLSGDGERDKNGVESVCDPNNLIERRISPPQFDERGHLITKPRDPEACAKLMATIDRVLGIEPAHETVAVQAEAA